MNQGDKFTKKEYCESVARSYRELHGFSKIKAWRYARLHWIKTPRVCKYRKFKYI